MNCNCGKESCRECALCGLYECEHHEFTPVVKPEGCCCDAREWGNPQKLPPVCSKFDGITSDHCNNCEHDYACHKEGQP